MAANPFRKNEFASYREWEQELVYFLLEQLRAPNVQAWRSLALDAETKRRAALMSYQLANFAFANRMPSENVLRPVFSMLMNRPPQLVDLKDWFSEKWVDQSRLASTLETAMRHGVTRATHALMA